MRAPDLVRGRGIEPRTKMCTVHFTILLLERTQKPPMRWPFAFLSRSGDDNADHPSTVGDGPRARAPPGPGAHAATDARADSARAGPGPPGQQRSSGGLVRYQRRASIEPGRAGILVVAGLILISSFAGNSLADYSPGHARAAIDKERLRDSMAEAVLRSKRS
jgi:hypothetical protein